MKYIILFLQIAILLSCNTNFETKENVHELTLKVHKLTSQKKYREAVDILNGLENSSFKRKLLGYIYYSSGDSEEAIKQFEKALELHEYNEVESPKDLYKLVDYAMLEAIAGNKEKATQRINDILSIGWVESDHSEYLEPFRNELEYYNGNPITVFDDSVKLVLCTSNIDSLTNILKKNHINVKGTCGSGAVKGKVFVTKKFINGLLKLELDTCETRISRRGIECKTEKVN